MQIKPAGGQAPSIPRRPQLHSAKHHHTYNGARYLPIATWVKSPTVRATIAGDCSLVYEVKLYYKHNRACTIYRSWEDFVLLRRGLSSNPGPLPTFEAEDDIDGLHNFLWSALKKRGSECSVEYFMRRRMEDCWTG